MPSAAAVAALVVFGWYNYLHLRCDLGIGDVAAAAAASRNHIPSAVNRVFVVAVRIVVGLVVVRHPLQLQLQQVAHVGQRFASAAHWLGKDPCQCAWRGVG